jgi:hypothetical protein
MGKVARGSSSRHGRCVVGTHLALKKRKFLDPGSWLLHVNQIIVQSLNIIMEYLLSNF